MDSPVNVLNTSQAVGKEMGMLDSLLDCEDMSKLLMGAYYKNQNISFLDYVYSNLGASIVKVDTHTPD